MRLSYLAHIPSLAKCFAGCHSVSGSSLSQKLDVEAFHPRCWYSCMYWVCLVLHSKKSFLRILFNSIWRRWKFAWVSLLPSLKHLLKSRIRRSIMEMQVIVTELLSSFEFSLPEESFELIYAFGAQSLSPVVKGKTQEGEQVPLRVTVCKL